MWPVMKRAGGTRDIYGDLLSAVLLQRRMCRGSVRTRALSGERRVVESGDGVNRVRSPGVLYARMRRSVTAFPVPYYGLVYLTRI